MRTAIKNRTLLSIRKKEKDVFVRSEKTETKILGNFSKPTLLQFEAIQNAFDFYNTQLFLPEFGTKLSPVFFSLNDNYRRTSKGYYAYDKYTNKSGDVFSLINITPEHLNQRFENVMSTLVHEMAHHFQYTQGKSKGRKLLYHNKEFASIMERLGLICSDTGRLGGKKTGKRMTHYILDGGKFELLTAFAPSKIRIPFKLNQNITIQGLKTLEEERLTEQKRKVKYECISCNSRVWGKPNLQISCVACDTMFEQA